MSSSSFYRTNILLIYKIDTGIFLAQCGFDKLFVFYLCDFRISKISMLNLSVVLFLIPGQGKYFNSMCDIFESESSKFLSKRKKSCEGEVIVFYHYFIPVLF